MKKALVLSLAAVLGLGFASFAQTLSGSWDTTIGIQPGPPVVLSIDSELIVTYAVSGWSFTSDTVVDETGWTKQHFDVSGSLGAFSLGSVLTFNPTGGAFTSWVVDGGLSLAGVTFDAAFTLVPNNTKLVITAGGAAGTVDVGATITFGDTDGVDGCDLDFASVLINVGFPFCCADVASEIYFTCAGFQYVEFTVEGIALPGISWVTLDAVLTFEVDEKTLELTPSFDFGLTACFDIYLSEPGEIFGDVVVQGIGIECEIGGVSFTGISWLDDETADDDKPGILAGTPYWEAYQIATTDDGCCGPFTFDITVFFLEGGAMLFDVSAIEANFDIVISTQFTFGMGLMLDFDAAPVFSSWTLHFLVEW
jgi:hypothetical protein